MKDIEKYITSVVSKWVLMFSDIERVRYAYDAMSDFHIVEVSPEKVRTENEEFASEELALWDDFMDRFPDADLLICGPSDVNDMSNIIYDSTAEYSMTGVVSNGFETDYVFDIQYFDDSFTFDNFNNYLIAA